MFGCTIDRDISYIDIVERVKFNLFRRSRVILQQQVNIPEGSITAFEKLESLVGFCGGEQEGGKKLTTKIK